MPAVRWRGLRRGATRSAVRAAVGLGRTLDPAAARRLGEVLGSVARWAVPLRRRLASNLRLAGLEPTTARLDRYFANFGRLAGWSMAVYQAGLERSGVAELIDLDESISHMDRAVAAGRGAILAAPHMFCHEMFAATVNRRYPVVAVIRENRSPEREALKRRWFEATGMATVRRPRHSSAVADTLACLRVLRTGRVLAITPDLIVPAGRGVPVTIFGREVHLMPGIAVLSMRSGAPVVTGFVDWRGRRAHLFFAQPAIFSVGPGPDKGVQRGMQAWCSLLEAYLTEHPENWMFWLDKRWTRALRGRADSRSAS